MASSSHARGSLRFLGLLSALSGGLSSSPDLFTTNVMCSPKHCINPLFPALEDLGRLEKLKWVCQDQHKIIRSMSFCLDAVHWPAAIIVPDNEEGESLSALVKKQEQMAITMYAYHLSGMGFEHWDHPRPWEETDKCIESVWKAVCWTYFPKQEKDCKTGDETPYLKPCKDACESYITECGVECCDESVQCVFEHKAYVNKSSEVVSTGYAPQISPSQKCTGGTEKSRTASKKAWERAYNTLSNIIPIASFVGMGIFSYGSLYGGNSKDRLYS